MIAFAKPPGTATFRPAEELLSEFRQFGAEAPFEELVRRYAAMVFSECYAVTKSRHDAEDAAQATFLTLAIQARTGDEIRHLGPWLQRVARRVALDQAKAKRRRQKREDNHHRVNGSTGMATPENMSLDQLELRHLISEELQQLPARYRMPLVLHYFGGLTREQMARELKCKPATLGVRLFRAREMLGKRLSKRGITLPMAAVPIAIAMVVRESVETHGVMSMAATAQQIARAASHVALGQTYAGQAFVAHAVASSGLSPHALAMVDSAAHSLILKKVKAIIAAAAIGASALAAGGADVVKRIHNGQIAMPEFLDVGNYFRFLIAPDGPRMVADATPVNPVRQDLELVVSAGLPHPGLSAERGVRHEFDGVHLTSAEMPSGIGGMFTQQSDLASALTLSGAGGHMSSSPAAISHTESPPIEAAPAKSAERASSADGLEPVMASSSDGNSEAGSTFGAFGGGGGGGMGVTSSAMVATLNPVQPMAARGNGGAPFASPLSRGSSSGGGAPTYTTDGGVLRGWGKVGFTGTFDMNGVVIADGNHADRTLDLTSLSGISNTIANGPAEVNGWYAQHGGKLLLPAMPFGSGTSTVTWGDDVSATGALHLVNSLRLTLHNATGAGLLTVALMATDRSDIPSLPGGFDVISVWSLASTAVYSSLDVQTRYVLPGSDLAGVTSGLTLYYFAGGKWHLTDSEIDPLHRLLTATNLPLSTYLALIAAPGKAGSPLGQVGIADGETARSTDDDAMSADAGIEYAPTSLGDLTPAERAEYARSFRVEAADGDGVNTLSYDFLREAAYSEEPYPGLTSLSGSFSPDGASPGGTLPNSVPVVPEPTGMAWLAAAVPFLGRRRR